jgi:hypothetical protein
MIIGLMAAAGAALAAEVGQPAGGELSHLPQVQLVHAGREPRRELRYSVAPGEAYALEFSMRLEHVGGPGSQDLEMAVTARSRIEVKDADEDSLRYDMTNESIQFDALPEFLARGGEWEKAVRQGEGIRHRMRTDRRGRLLIKGTEAPPGASAVMAMMDRQGMSGMGMVLLPEEAVGPGAQWKVELTGLPGETGPQMQIFRLASMEGDVLHLLVEGDVAGVAQEGSKGKPQPGVAVRINGDIVMSLREPMPRRMTMEMETGAAPAGSPSGQGMRMQMVIKGEKVGDGEDARR